MAAPDRDLGRAPADIDAWPDVTIGVIAALTIEGAAMRTLMAAPRTVRVDDDPHEYRVGHLDSADPDRPHRIVLATLAEDNTRNAAATCTDMLRSFPHIRCVVMAGIAGGVPAPQRPERHVRLGDLVVASGIVDYGHIRQNTDGAAQRRPVSGISMDLKRVAQRLEEDQILGATMDWTQLLSPPEEYPMAVFARPPESKDRLHRGRRVIPHPDRARSGHLADRPKVHFGSIGSADVLLKSAQVRDRLAAQHDVLAFEMETAGVAAGVANRGVNWFVVRGIVDYCDEHKNNDWHQYGSLVAAGGVRALLARCAPFPVWRLSPDGARTLLPDLEMAALRDLLEQARDLDGEAIWEAAAGDTVLVPERPATLAEMAVLLAGRNAGPDRIPPLVALVEHVAVRVAHRLAGQLRSWVDRVARSTMHIEELIPAFRQSVEHRHNHDKAGHHLPIRPCLLIQIERDGMESGSCEVRYWIQRRPRRWDPEPSDPRQTTFRELERVLQTALREAESTWRDLGDEPVEIELLLPADLLHTAVEWWHTELDAPASTPLCLEYRVVVRSLDRMREAHRRRTWANRWRSLWRDPARHRVHWGRTEPDDAGLGPWNARLREDHSLTTVILGNSPEDESGRQELASALNAGIPVILWDHRRGALAPEMAGLLDGITAGPPADLPGRVHALRRDAGLLAPADQASHPGRHLAVLWDDPDRNVLDTGALP
jgi:nucleoside phosphorylase